MATFGNGYSAWRRNRWQDWAEVVLAVWLFISPWVLQFGGPAPRGMVLQPELAVANAAWNAWVMGILVFFVAISAVSRMSAWHEWLLIIFGAWIFAAPWVLGFLGLPAASWDQWGTGAAIFLIALWNLSATGGASEDGPVPPSDKGW